MTVAIPEAADVAEGIVVPGSSTYETYGTRPRRAARRSRGGTSRVRSAAPRAASSVGAQAAGAYAGSAAGVGRAAAGAQLPGDRSYQGVILAEFLTAEILIAFTPLATGGSATAQAKNSPSPYSVPDLVQLVATGAVYFVLALVSSGNHGRVAAWLGGLILIAIGLSKAGQAQLTTVFKTLAGQQTGSTSAGSSGES